MEKILYAIPELCTGCNRCAYVCSSTKEGIFIPSRSRIHINNFSFNGYSVPSICFQCEKPDCLKVCPEKAINKDGNGVVLIDREKCNGCGDCVNACPYGMIELDEEKFAYKCDYCGGDPACVKECYPGALVYKEPEHEVRKLRGLQMKQRIESEAPKKKRYQLGLNILKHARQAEALG